MHEFNFQFNIKINWFLIGSTYNDQFKEYENEIEASIGIRKAHF